MVKVVLNHIASLSNMRAVLTGISVKGSDNKLDKFSISYPIHSGRQAENHWGRSMKSLWPLLHSSASAAGRISAINSLGHKFITLNAILNKKRPPGMDVLQVKSTVKHTLSSAFLYWFYSLTPELACVLRVLIPSPKKGKRFSQAW